MKIIKTFEKVQKINNEDFGKTFEMAICLLYNTRYDGVFKYNLSEAEKIKKDISKLKNKFCFDLKHIAKNGNRYDFVSTGEKQINLSVKTSKKDGKICPQVIGQPTKKRFCEFFKINEACSENDIKEYIQINVKILLDNYIDYTFDCPIVYYNKHKRILLFISLINKIKWEEFEITFSHIKRNKKWNESSSIYINNINIGEFQIHKHRDCVKFRWSLEKLLNLFKNNFEISDLSF